MTTRSSTLLPGSGGNTGPLSAIGEQGAAFPVPDALDRGAEEAAGRPQGNVLGLWRHKGVLLMAVDAITISSTFMLAYYLRFKWPVLAGDGGNVPQIFPYLQGAFFLALFWVFLIWRDNGYERGLLVGQNLLRKMRTVAISGFYALGLMMVISFMLKELMLSRQVYIMTSALAFGTMLLSRLLFRAIDQDLASQGLVAYRVIMGGTSAQLAEFASLISQTPSLCKIVGFADLGNGREQHSTYKGFPVLGDLSDIREIHRCNPFDMLVLPNALENRSGGFIEVLNFCEAEDISVYSLPNNFHIAVDQREVGSFAGIPVMLLRDAAIRPTYAVIKRCIDIVGSLLILTALAPLWLAIAAAVKLYDRGPILFLQTRAGLHGRPFRMYKFRSMTVGAEKKRGELVDLKALAEPVFKIKNDPRVTPLGKILRRTGLDEIPQLLNVLKGEMSLVGPRPEEMEVVNRYTHWQRRRLKAVPGITGYQQVHNRGEPLLTRRIQYDLLYIKHQSLLLDLYIMLKTIKVVLLGEGVTH